jgi:hypothetical protein
MRHRGNKIQEQIGKRTVFMYNIDKGTNGPGRDME